MGRRDQWYENAVIYCLDVETYADSNGDGVGDFPGLTRRLDYLSGLGGTCIWLMPFYPSPNRDDGYDVADYTAVDPRFGTAGDFSEFMVEASERGIRVIVDLIPNHTSDQHPWFQKALEGPDSPYYDYYIWRDEDPGDTSDRVVFPGEQKGIWTYSKDVDAWYLHHFHAFQPDLNYANPAVQAEFHKIMGYWLELGVSGFRVDAAPFLISLEGIDKGYSDMQNAHQFLEQMRDFVTVRRGDAILLGEVDEGLSTIADYFGGGNQIQALFNFPLNRFAFLGLAKQSADPINFGLGQLPSIPGSGQWVNFLRHHDELNLSRMPKEDRAFIIQAFGPEPEMQIYDRGLRRRLAPMLGGDPARLRMAYSLLFSLPGAPLLFYGEEIGMGENLAVPGRLAVRTPMQWRPRPGAGFSPAPEDRLVRPVVSEGEYGYAEVSVGGERGDPDSLLNWIASLIRVRKECGEIGSGAWKLVETGSDAVFAIRYDVEDSTVLVVTNLSPDAQEIALEIEPSDLDGETDLLGDRQYEPLDANHRNMRIEGYGFRWMRLRGVY